MTLQQASPLWALCLVVLAATQVRAESAERLTVQRHHSRTVNLGQPIRRVVVASPDILVATQVAPDVVELHGERVGRSMVLVFTERGRLVLVVDVELEPQERQQAIPQTVEAPVAGTGASLYAYRGTADLRIIDGVTMAGHQHTASAYQPVGPGQLYSFATADVVGLDDRVRLGAFLLRYHDPLLSLQAGDVTTEAMPLLLSPTAIRGLAGTYHGDNVRMGAYGGLEPGGRHPALVFDATRTQRIGTFAELELAPNASLAVHGLRRERVPTVLGPRTVTQIVPTLRWEPGPSLGIEASGGVSELGHGWTAQLRYGVPLAQVGASYWMQSHGYLYPGAPRLDSMSANLVVRPSRRVNLWGVATRTTRGTHALAQRADANAVRDTESVQLSFMADPILSQLQLGFTRSLDVGAQSGTAPAPEIQRQMWTLYADRAMPLKLGRVSFRGSSTDYAPVTGVRGQATSNQGDLTWQGNASFFTYVLGAGYSQSRAELLDGSIDRRQRYSINETLGVQLTTLLAMLRLQLTRDAVSERAYTTGAVVGADDLTRDSVAAYLRLVYRPTAAHELTADVFLNNLLIGAPRSDVLVPAGLLEETTATTVFLTYAFYFGDAVQTPGLLDALSSETVRLETFLDANEDGLRNADESAVEGVSVYLDGGERRITDRDGTVEFRGLGESLHRVTADVNGAAKGGRSLRFTTASAQLVKLAPGEHRTISVGLSDRSRIAGAVFNDANLDGEQQSEDPGIAGIAVTLWQGARVAAETRTSPTGAFEFSTLAPGPYKVSIAREKLPGNHEALNPDAALTVGSSQIARVMVPVVAYRSIEGRVFVDRNDNGVFDDGEDPLSGADVHWDGKSVKSNGGGKYLIRRLPAGEVQIWIDPISLPPGHEATGRIPVMLPMEPANVELDLPVRRVVPVS